jgi:DNA-binding CsgD family transcriptional regulator/pimeloyl-ACP methyl ester carboxylesterase
MDAPPVQYVKTSDGYDIAYAVCGAGPALVMMGSGGFEHVQLAWQVPGLDDLLAALASRFTLVQLDPRGTGMSQRDLQDSHSMDHYQHDLHAVVEHLKLEQFVLYGALYHLSYMPVQYTVEHADRVRALILAGTGTSMAAYRVPALFETLPAQGWDLFLQFMVGGGSTQTPEVTEERVELWRQALDQKDFVPLVREAGPRLLGPLLEQLKVPTLVLRPRQFQLLAPDEPGKVARLARARLVTLDGDAVLTMAADQVIRAIESFLADLPPSEDLTAPATKDLSERELEVLKLLAQGRSNPQIAEALFITRNTVQNHVSSILIKLKLQNRAQAAVYAKEHGII